MKRPIAAPPRLLLVQDCTGDVMLFKAALAESGTPWVLDVLDNGEAAVQWLFRRSPDAPRPDLLVTDRYLPRRSGLELLRVIRNEEDLRTLPVIFLVGGSEAEVVAAYAAGASCCVMRGIDLDGYLEALKAMLVFWGRFVRLPRRPAW